jgi:hypothetical protein
MIKKPFSDDNHEFNVLVHDFSDAVKELILLSKKSDLERLWSEYKKKRDSYSLHLIGSDIEQFYFSELVRVAKMEKMPEIIDARIKNLLLEVKNIVFRREKVFNPSEDIGGVEDEFVHDQASDSGEVVSEAENSDSGRKRKR